MNKRFFDDVVNVRINKVQLKEVSKIMRSCPDIWENESHFVRSAISYFIRHIKEGKFRVVME